MNPFSPQPAPSPIRAGDTILFLGDHTGAGEPGYVQVVSSVVERFHPGLRLTLVSAGRPGQTASALHSSEVVEAVRSTRPAWLVVGVGLADAFSEPEAHRLIDDYRRWLDSIEEADETTIGPEHGAPPEESGPRYDGARSQLQAPPPHSNLKLERLEGFTLALETLVLEMQEAGVRCVLMTTIIVANDPHHPMNAILKEYNRAIRTLAAGHGVPVVDVEQAFAAVYERAANYKQKVALTIPPATLNPQGEALVARTFLDTMGLLPRRG